MSRQKGKGQVADVQMPFTSHLAELRARLVKSVVALAIAFAACYALAEQIFVLLAAPLKQIPVAGLTLIGTAVTEAFFTKLKVSFVAALFVASPVLLWQAWQFVAPGLYDHEKRYSRSLFFIGTLFFVAGGAFCYGVVIHQGLHFLLRRYEAIGVVPMLKIGDYLSVVSRLVLAFGVMFELPVVAFFLARIGLIDHRFLIRHSRYAVIALALLAAVLTPPDLISQVLLMIPLALLYLLSIGVAYLARWRMNRLDRME
ncbi:MAG TPA: twin-arginine translocase subunit TatC [Candidatus Limnocylindria bacterium]|nr:twin-arginine translocase subunit TatC [Candidatus Limnocylindria bacterium]